jgi:hypothetical protein
MIRVTLELVPGGVGEPEHLGTIEISNQIRRSMTNSRRADYKYDLWKKRNRLSIPWANGVIEDFPRLSYHPWNLIRAILNQIAEANGGKI